MNRSYSTTCTARPLRAIKLGLLLLSLATMIGCQGVSSGQPQQSGILALSNASLDFGSVTAGTSKTLSVTVSNTGAASLTISSASFSSQHFSLSAPSLPVTIGAGQSSTISLAFSPNAAGAFSATASITSNASNSSSSLSLSGTGVANGQLAANPTSENFGSVTVGTQSNRTVTLTNNNSSSIDISQVSVSGTGFQLSGITTPVTLNASQSTTFVVSFAPQSAAAASGSVTITSNAPSPTL